jgi:endonuclease YncB( thermonuclease family)
VNVPLALALTALLGCSFGAAAQTALDGDTIRLDGTVYRLWGIDAPERSQVCPDGWRAGRLAMDHLIGLMRARHVTCKARDQDRHGRTVALCHADRKDLGAEMVSAGMARAYASQSWDYLPREWWAWAHDRGLHAHDCETPWDWRARQPPRQAQGR